VRIFKKIKDIEIYKFGLISPVLHGSVKSQNEYFKLLSEQGVSIPPNSDNLYFLKSSTFKSWLAKYKAFGLEGLCNKLRSDKGKFKKITPEVIKSIEKVKDEWE